MTSFQVISFEGEYNDKTFKEKFLSFNNISLDNYCSQIKHKLSRRYREELISSRIIWTQRDEISEEILESEVEDNIPIDIQNFLENNREKFPLNFKLINKISGLKYVQEIENRWDERGDGRKDIEYDEITFFTGKVDLYFFNFKN